MAEGMEIRLRKRGTGRADKDNSTRSTKDSRGSGGTGSHSTTLGLHSVSTSSRGLHSMRSSVTSLASRMSSFSLASNMGQQPSLGSTYAASHPACCDALGNYYVWMEPDAFRHLQT